MVGKVCIFHTVTVITTTDVSIFCAPSSQTYTVAIQSQCSHKLGSAWTLNKHLGHDTLCCMKHWWDVGYSRHLLYKVEKMNYFFMQHTGCIISNYNCEHPEQNICTWVQSNTVQDLKNSEHDYKYITVWAPDNYSTSTAKTTKAQQKVQCPSTSTVLDFQVWVRAHSHEYDVRFSMCRNIRVSNHRAATCMTRRYGVIAFSHIATPCKTPQRLVRASQIICYHNLDIPSLGI